MVFEFEQNIINLINIFVLIAYITATTQRAENDHRKQEGGDAQCNRVIFGVSNRLKNKCVCYVVQHSAFVA